MSARGWDTSGWPFVPLKGSGMTSRDLYALLGLLEKLDHEVATDAPAHLSIIILKIVTERMLTEHKELG